MPVGAEDCDVEVERKGGITTGTAEVREGEREGEGERVGQKVGVGRIGGIVSGATN